MGKADRILDLFPAFYRTVDRTKLLATFVGRLSAPLEEFDTHLFRIQRAHRLKVAEDVTDIVRLAGLLDLSPFHFEDIIGDQTVSYTEKLVLMRDRVRRIAALHLQGLGTPWAILEATAIFLRGTIVSPDRQGPQVVHVDREQYSHKAVIEFSYLAEKPRAHVYLHENPLRRNKIEAVERWQRNWWHISNNGTAKVGARFAVTGVSDHTVMPSLYCPQTEEGVLFYGIIPAGKTLVIDPTTGASLDDEPVDEWVIPFQGAVGGFGLFDRSRNAVDGAHPVMPFNGNLERSAAQLFQQKSGTATVPMGGSDWHFKVADGVYDGSLYDYSVCETDDAPIGVYDQDFGYDTSVYVYAGAGIVGMSWDERVACSFKVVLPNHLPYSKTSDQKSGGASDQRTPSIGNHASRIASILPRFKPAGVRAYVDVAQDSWVLGESVIKETNAAQNGEGIDFHSMKLLRNDADMLSLEVQ